MGEQKELNQKFDEAVKLYAKGIELLMKAMKNEEIKNKKQIKSKIKKTILTYLSKAEQIKEKMNESATSYFYPTHDKIQEAKKDATHTTICCIHGFVRSISSSLNVSYDIPNGIID